MHRDLIDLLVCPRSGAPLNLRVLEADGEEVEQGVLAGPAGSYPVLHGIPAFTDEAQAALPLVAAGRYAEAALAVAFGRLPGPPLARLAAGVAAVRPGGRVAAAVGRATAAERRRAFRSAFDRDGRAVAAEVVRLFYLASRARSVDAYHYFAYRYGTPRHLVALAAIDAAPDPDRPVLDLGCGAGHLTWPLAERMAPQPVVGVDRELVLLLAARHAVAPSASFVCADALSLPFRDGTFASALAADVLSFVRSKRAAVAELERVVAAGGSLAVTSVKNSLARHVFAGEPLPPEGWRGLVSHLDHRVVADSVLLDAYLDGSRLPDPGPGGGDDPAAVAASPLLSVLASRGGGGFRSGGRFPSWPHARGVLAVNPLFRPAGGGAGPYRRWFPPGAYAADNPELAAYLPEAFTLDAAELAAARAGRPGPAVEALVARVGVLGFPPGFVAAGLLHAVAA